MTKKELKDLAKRIKNTPVRSAWSNGVRQTAVELVENLIEGYSSDRIKEMKTRKQFEDALKNGAKTWLNYSWDGAGLIYDEEIAQRFCSASELKKTKNGTLRPNSKEDWLDVQARALFQSWKWIESEARRMKLFQ